MKSIMNTLAGNDEDLAIPSKMISRTVESSQRKVEGRNFGIRKTHFNMMML